MSAHMHVHRLGEIAGRAARLKDWDRMRSHAREADEFILSQPAETRHALRLTYEESFKAQAWIACGLDAGPG